MFQRSLSLRVWLLVGFLFLTAATMCAQSCQTCHNAGGYAGDGLQPPLAAPAEPWSAAGDPSLTVSGRAVAPASAYWVLTSNWLRSSEDVTTAAIHPKTQNPRCSFCRAASPVSRVAKNSKGLVIARNDVGEMVRVKRR
jgi:hypothetical protein